MTTMARFEREMEEFWVALGEALPPDDATDSEEGQDES